MKIYFTLLFAAILIVSCESKNVDVDHVEIQSSTDSTVNYSEEIHASPEFERIKEFLIWYKSGYDSLYFQRIEKYENRIISVDTKEAWALLSRYRNSGYFSQNKLANDSLYVLNAKEIYESNTLEVYDYFNHDFILKTQEVQQSLDSIPMIYAVPEMCDLKTGKITVEFGNPGLSRSTFHLIREDGKLKIDKID